MKKECYVTPQLVGKPFSAAVRSGDFIFVSGQNGEVDAQGNPVEDLAAQTQLCLEKIKKALELAGASLNDVVKVLVFLGKAGDFPKMNEVYQEFFKSDYPARSTVITGFIKPEMLIEIECIAYKP